MKGILLAGGNGTRLQPLTKIANKHLLPVYNKPMILYPLETLKSFGVNEVMLVSGGENIGGFAEFLGDGQRFGAELTYRVQEEAGGIAQALGLARAFVGKEKCAVILGDNIFEHSFNGGQGKSIIARFRYLSPLSCHLFFKKVKDPQRFGVPFFENEELVGIEEKPKEPKSELAVTGLYIYPPDVFEIVAGLKPSARGELEITDVNNFYVQQGRALWEEVPGFWSDAGTFESMHEAATFIKKCQKK